MNCKVLSCAFESQVCFAGQYPIKERTVYQKKKPSIVSEGFYAEFVRVFERGFGCIVFV